MRSPPKASVTIKQVAEAAGVHYSTVSRALNPATRDRVKPEIAALILDTALRLGYRANAAASSLRTRRSKVVGFVVPDLGSLLFPPILDGIEDELLALGYMTIIANTANDPARERRILTGLIERQVDGLIIATATLNEPLIEAWLESRAPVVLVNRTDESGRAPAVLHDDMRGIGLAVEHLVALGHSRIAHIAGPDWLSTGVTRQRGFRMAMTERLPGGRPPVVISATRFARDAGKSACIELLEKHPDITAIVAANDMLALGCYDALAERGLSCPADISVTGYNDTPLVDIVQPSLTTVQIRQREMGIEAARLLSALMSGEDRQANIVLRPALVIRNSTAAPK